MCQRQAQITIETAVIHSNFPSNTAGSNPVITTDVMNLNTFKVKQIYIKKAIMIILTSDMPSDIYFQIHTFILYWYKTIILTKSGNCNPSTWGNWFLSTSTFSLVRFSSSSPCKQLYLSCIVRHVGGSRFPKAYY